MFHSLCFYSKRSVQELEAILVQHQDDFSLLLEDTFSELELEQFENLLEDLSSPVVQTLSSELQFDDFEVLENEEKEQRRLFLEVKGALLLENVANLHFNPFQVSYIKEILRSLDDVLVDRGGFYPLLSKKAFLDSLKGYKTIFSLLKEEEKIIPQPILDFHNPIDMIISDIYKDLARLEDKGLTFETSDWPEKVRLLYLSLKKNKQNAQTLLGETKLSPKDFGDNLEKLKFMLRKMN